jgi:seryl-tRNA synthetase
MLDIKFIRENLELCKTAAVNKNRKVEWERLLEADDKRRTLIGKIELLRNERNKNKGDSEESRQKGKDIKVELKSYEDELRTAETEFNDLMLTVPNVPDKSVPIGKDSSGNVEIKKWGTPKQFGFKIKDHTELAKTLDLIDFERGNKVGGFRAYFLKNEGALLEMAIISYALQKLTNKGYTPLIAPALVKELTLYGNAQFPWGRDEVYHLEKDDLYLSGTAEQPVTAYYSGEVLNESDLPKKFVAFSPCFREEAGSYGKDTKGIYRVHQFNKVEQVIISTNDMNNSFTLHEELLHNSEEILQDLELPYRVMLMCTGDMGEPQVKKYDIETWMPGRPAPDGAGFGDYGETMSNSVMGDFQARRLKIKYKTKSGEIKFCHTLNNTAIASPRILIPILENYQQADGSVLIPKVLQPFVGKEVIHLK